MLEYIVIYYDWCGELFMHEHSTVESASMVYEELKKLYEDNVWLAKVINCDKEI